MSFSKKSTYDIEPCDSRGVGQGGGGGGSRGSDDPPPLFWGGANVIPFLCKVLVVSP